MHSASHQVQRGREEEFMEVPVGGGGDKSVISPPPARGSLSSSSEDTGSPPPPSVPQPLPPAEMNKRLLGKHTINA